MNAEDRIPDIIGQKANEYLCKMQEDRLPIKIQRYNPKKEEKAAGCENDTPVPCMKGI